MSRFRISPIRAFLSRMRLLERYPAQSVLPPPEPQRPAIPQEFLRDVGAIAVNWTQVENEWGLIFKTLTRDLPPEKASSILRQFQTSSGQRELVMGVADAEPVLPIELRADLGSFHAESNIVAGERNALVHCLLEIGWSEYRYRYSLLIAAADVAGRPNILGGKNALSEARRVANRTTLLRHRLKKFRERLEGTSALTPPAPPPRRRRRKA